MDAGALLTGETKVESSENLTSRSENDLSTELSDWSATGRGSHIDFDHDEPIPLVQGMLSRP